LPGSLYRCLADSQQARIQNQKTFHAEMLILWTMKISVPVVEVRVPTFNRPALLRRALESLLVQTHSDWRAVILDDGNIEPTRALLGEMRDQRFVHRPNVNRLGAAKNIGQSFFERALRRRRAFRCS
jgi:hypothetical protein